MTTKGKLISVRMPDELRDQVRAQAHAQRMTMSAYVRVLIEAKLNPTPEE